MAGTYTISAIILVAFFAALRVIWRRYFTLDPREPPCVPSTIPLIGHYISLIRDGMPYLQQTAAKVNAPAHTLLQLAGRQYILTDPALVNLAFRNEKTISFNPFIAEFGIRITGASPRARKIIETNIEGAKGQRSYVVEVHEAMRKAMFPGDELDELTRRMLTMAARNYIKPLEAEITRHNASGDGYVVSGTTIQMHEWFKKLLTKCSSAAIFGPEVPFLQGDEAYEDFWCYEKGIGMLMLGRVGQWLAPRSHAALNRLSGAFGRWNETHRAGRSPMAEARLRIGTELGHSLPDLGRMDVGELIGLLVNTVPTTSWLLLRLLTEENGKLLEQVREEITRNVVERRNRRSIFNAKKVREGSPLLYSTYQEVLRFYNHFAAPRLVTDDTMLGDRWLLKKNSVVLVPNSVMHHSAVAWGPTHFDARRFIKRDLAAEDPAAAATRNISSTNEKPSTRDKSTVSAAAYRPFGGGSTLCPGRHFASLEILSLVALLVWRFDIDFVDERFRQVGIPEPKQLSIVEAVAPPAVVVELRLKSLHLSGQTATEVEDWDVCVE